MTPQLAEAKDIHKRSTDEVNRDKWFMQHYRLQTGAVPKLDPARFLFSKKGHFVEIVKNNAGGEPEIIQIKLQPRCYDKATVERVLTENAKAGASAKVIEKALADAAFTDFVVVANENQTGNPCLFDVAFMPEGTVRTSVTQLQPINGTLLREIDGKTVMGSITSRDEYMKWLPLLQQVQQPANGFTMDFACEEVAHMADDAEKMLAALRAQVENIQGVEVYAIMPRWLRYYSDGDMKTQRSALHGIRNAPYPNSGGGEYMRPLLYDGPAWLVGLKLGDKFLPGRCFVNADGSFICSDWCQREVDKGGGIDLYTGASAKHTLMTWVAGPAISRFGDPKLQESHKLRPMQRAPKRSLSYTNPLVQELAKHVIRIRRGTKLDANGTLIHHPQLKETPLQQAPDSMGVSSVRYYEMPSVNVTVTGVPKGNLCQAGFFCTLSHKDHWSVAVAINVVFDKKTLKPILTGINPVMECLAGGNSSSFYQNATVGGFSTQFKIGDQALLKEVYKAMQKLMMETVSPAASSEDEDDD